VIWWELCQGLIDLVSPRVCMACGQPHPRELCGSCRASIPAAPPVSKIAGAPLFCATSYAAPIDGLIQRFKYSGRADLARPLARLIFERLAPELSFPDVWLVPVPLHPERLAERGYNQAALLARELARPMAARLRPRALQREIATRAQARLKRDARAENVRDAFRARQAVEGRAVIVVDDVVTTGATVAGSIAALRAARARVVGVLAIARAGSAERPEKRVFVRESTMEIATTLGK
jgi:ComF family protein